MIYDVAQWAMDMVFWVLNGLVGWVIWLIGAAVVILVVGIGSLWRKLSGGPRQEGTRQ